MDNTEVLLSVAGVLLIAAGIGVTPMRVMFAECLKRGYPVVFLYSFRTCEDGAFLTEFYNVRQNAFSFTANFILHWSLCSPGFLKLQVRAG